MALKRVCDFCNKQIINIEKTIFIYKKKKFRVAILKINIQNGLRWREADICEKCFNKHVKGRL
jgi:hypothetical protein